MRYEQAPRHVKREDLNLNTHVHCGAHGENSLSPNSPAKRESGAAPKSSCSGVAVSL